MELVDTHCHIHFPDYELDPEESIKNAQADAVMRLMCVGCTLIDSKLAVEMAARYDNIWASIGLHPHEAHHYVCDASSCLAAKLQAPSKLLAHRDVEDSSAPSSYRSYASVRASSSPSAASKHKHNDMLSIFASLASKPKVVAIGETGLDYHYMHSPKEVQEKLLRFQLDLALEYELPLIFHIREAFDDFWRIYDEYIAEDFKIRGVVHSFSAGLKELDDVLKRELYVGLNGIMTFTKSDEQLEAAKQVPQSKILLETDAPFLTPVPYRGKICEPKYVKVIAQFLSQLRGETLEQLAAASTQNAINLFGIR